MKKGTAAEIKHVLDEDIFFLFSSLYFIFLILFFGVFNHLSLVALETNHLVFKTKYNNGSILNLFR